MVELIIPISPVPIREFRFSDSRCVLGIEPNEHRTPRFQGKYSYHTHLSENPERTNSPNVLPMSQCYWGVGFFDSVNLSVTRGNREEQWD